MIDISAEWREFFPNASFGVLLMKKIANYPVCAELSAVRSETENGLRSLYGGKTRKELRATSPFAEYETYFRGFGQGYPVLAQVESVAIKHKPIISPSALVGAMFIMELKNGLLTAGHDFDLLMEPLTLDVGGGNDSYLALGGRDRKVQDGDMLLRDGRGILSSVIYGPDDRTFISENTTSVLFTVYGVPGIQASCVSDHLRDIEALVGRFSPGASTSVLKVY